MLDPTDETLTALADVSKILPRRRGGRKAHISGIYRWSTIGIRGVVLETTQVGGTRCTSPAALCRFFESLAAPQAHPQPARTPRQRERAIADAGRELEQAGA